MKVKLLAVKVVGGIGIAAFLCCFAPTLRRATAAGGSQQSAAKADSSPDCPNVDVPSMKSDPTAPNITLSGVEAFESAHAGMMGLPCNSGAALHAPGKAPNALQFQLSFDYYSWLTFIALNSPASGVDPIGKDAPTIWETWKQLPDVMLVDEKNRTSWNHPNKPFVPSECQSQFKDGAMIFHMEKETPETYNEPFLSGPLFDQNGNYALFVIFLNRQMYQYINGNGLDTIEGQQAFPDQIDFPNGDSAKDKNTPGSIMVKASWKILLPGKDFGPGIESKYHMINGLLYRGQGQPCTGAVLGLIGFHVGHKTVNRQQWVWTTFEHHDNVPTQQEVASGAAKGRKYNFYCSDAECQSREINETPLGPWDPAELNWDPSHPNPFHSQIVRMGPSPIFDDVTTLNDIFHQALANTVWKNYDLITTQWPSGFPCSTLPNPGSLPDATCAPFPTFLANSTLETFSQPRSASHDGGVPLATSSCISCHNNATTHHVPATRSDFTFILEKAKAKTTH